MASIVVRNIDDDLKARLRVQAARHGRSMEAEAREILRRGVAGDEPRQETLGDLVRYIRRNRPDDEEDFDLMDYIPPREPMREPPNFD